MGLSQYVDVLLEKEAAQKSLKISGKSIPSSQVLFERTMITGRICSGLRV
jgi:hypothetical protein